MSSKGLKSSAQAQQAVAPHRPYNEWGKEGKFAPRWYLVGDIWCECFERPRSVDADRYPGRTAEILGINKGLRQLFR
jgi:hypothetical protein